MKFPPVTILPVALLGVSLVAVPTAAGAAPGADDSISAATALLLGAQGHHEDGSEVPGWEWHLGQGNQAANIGGVIAASLLEAHLATKNPQPLIAAIRYGTQLREQRPDGARLTRPDIGFLARLGQITGDERFTQLAVRGFERIEKTSPRGSEGVEWLRKARAGRTTLVGFDTAHTIRAALAVGRSGYAIEMAEAIAPEFRNLDAIFPVDSYESVSRAAILGAIDAVRRETSVKSETLDGASKELTDWLVLTQEHNGSWRFNETQVTAYAVQALALSNRGEARIAAERGADWLRATLLPGGRWAHYNDGMPEPFVGKLVPEVMAEALHALVAHDTRRGT